MVYFSTSCCPSTKKRARGYVQEACSLVVLVLVQHWHRFQNNLYIEECRLLGCDAVWFMWEPTFWRNVASIFRVKRIRELWKTLAVTMNWSQLSSVQLLVTDKILPTSLIPFTLMMEMTSSSETSLLTRVTRRHIQEYGLLHNHLRENQKLTNV
jgi:hypothetical protein